MTGNYFRVLCFSGLLCSFSDLSLATLQLQDWEKGTVPATEAKIETAFDICVSACSPSLHSALWVPAYHHWPTRLHPLRGHVRRPAAGHHLAERWTANPRQSGRDRGQHWLHQLAAHLQPNAWPQWQLHLHRTQRSCCCGAPESAYCERWENTKERRSKDYMFNGT